MKVRSSAGRWLGRAPLVFGAALLVACTGVTPPSPPAPEPLPTEAPKAERPTPGPTARPAGTPSDWSPTVWSADHETGDLSQWTADQTLGGAYDSGDCVRPRNGVSNEQAHSGRYSMKMTIDTSSEESGCRQFRHQESTSGRPYYYSAWFYFPEKVEITEYWNIFQFKSEDRSHNDAFWVLEVRNRPNGNPYVQLRWKGVVSGPTEGEDEGVKHYDQFIKDVPIRRWFHLEALLHQSDEFNGRIVVWQDGEKLFDLDRVKTKYRKGDQRWSINNYSSGLARSRASIFVDDAMITTARVSTSLHRSDRDLIELEASGRR